MTAYCKYETPVMDIEHDAGCRRCGLPVDFSPLPFEVVCENGDRAEAEDLNGAWCAVRTFRKDAREGWMSKRPTMWILYEGMCIREISPTEVV